MTFNNREKMSGHRVRLFPSVHIKSEKETELRAASSLLSVIHSVSEFGKGIVRRAGGPAGRISCWTEVEYLLQQEQGKPPLKVRPDGVIEASYGKKRWGALVEVKVGNCILEEDQVTQYHQLARQEGFHALITVSNQAAQTDDRPPVKLNGQLLRTIPVIHYSWTRLLSEAQVLSRKKEVSDPDQKWILDEWVRYVDDPKSKILVPAHLGRHWVEVQKVFQTGNMPASSPELKDVIRHWIGYLQKAALRLRAKLGVEVYVKLAKGKKEKLDKLVQKLAMITSKEQVLRGILKVRDAAGDISVEVFLASRKVLYSLTVRAPIEGKQATRVRWLARQLRSLNEMPNELKVTAEWNAKGVVTQCLARELVDDVMPLLVDKQKAPIPKQLMPERFLLQLEKSLVRGHGKSSAPVLENITGGLEDFYRTVVEGIVKYVLKPYVPRMPPPEESEPESNSLVSGLTFHSQPLLADMSPEIATSKVPQHEKASEE